MNLKLSPVLNAGKFQPVSIPNRDFMNLKPPCPLAFCTSKIVSIPNRDFMNLKQGSYSPVLPRSRVSIPNRDFMNLKRHKVAGL